MQTCFLHKFSLMTIFLIVKERLQRHQTIIKILSKEEIKKWLMDTIVYNENIEAEDLNELANIVGKCEETMDIIKKYEDITKTNKKNMMFLAYQQGKVFRKFKENRKI